MTYEDPLVGERRDLVAQLETLKGEYARAIWEPEEVRREIWRRMYGVWKTIHRGHADTKISQTAFEEYLRTGREPT